MVAEAILAIVFLLWLLSLEWRLGRLTLSQAEDAGAPLVVGRPKLKSFQEVIREASPAPTVREAAEELQDYPVAYTARRGRAMQRAREIVDMLNEIRVKRG